MGDTQIKRNEIIEMIHSRGATPSGSSGPGAVYETFPFDDLNDVPVRRSDSDTRFSCMTKALEKFAGRDWSGAKVLDIGCASGNMSFRAHLAGAEQVVGLDYDPDSLRIARAVSELKEIDRIEFVNGDFGSGFFEPGEQFDVAFCLSVIHWLIGAHGEEKVCEAFQKVFSPNLILFYEGGISKKPSHGVDIPHVLTAKWIRQFWGQVGFTKFVHLHSFDMEHQPGLKRPLWIMGSEETLRAPSLMERLVWRFGRPWE